MMLSNDVTILIFYEVHRDLMKRLNEEYRKCTRVYDGARSGVVYFLIDDFRNFVFNRRHLNDISIATNIFNLTGFKQYVSNNVGIVPNIYIFSSGKLHPAAFM